MWVAAYTWLMFVEKYPWSGGFYYVSPAYSMANVDYSGEFDTMWESCWRFDFDHQMEFGAY